MSNEEFLRSISLEGEVWKDVVGYEGLYVVSNYGRVCALERKVTTKPSRRSRSYQFTCHATLLKPLSFSRKTEHQTVNLCKDGTTTHAYIHRLVALHFIPNPNNLPLVEHLDCDPTNNHISNLRWTTQTGNMNNPITLKRMSESQKKRDFSMYHKPVVCILPSGEVRKYKCMAETQKDGFRPNCVSRACSGDIQTHQKCRWMYLSDYESSNQ